MKIQLLHVEESLALYMHKDTKSAYVVVSGLLIVEHEYLWGDKFP